MAGDVAPEQNHSEPGDFDPWYRWGVAILYAEMGTAILVTIYSLYMAFTGSGGIGGH